MKKIIYTFLLLFITIVYSQEQTNYSKGHLIIKIKENYYNDSKVNFLENKLGIKTIDNFNIDNGIIKIKAIGQQKITKTFLLIFTDNIDINAILLKYKNFESIDFVELDYIGQIGGQKIDDKTLQTVPNDTNFNKQWGLFNNGTMTGIGTVTNDADVDMELAWDIETGDPNLIIAVPDSGLNMSHPDIVSQLWLNTPEIINGIDDDSNGFIDDINGWDWVNSDNDPTDDHGHGTNVIGIIGAAANNGFLFSGVNWNSKIMPLKVIDENNSATYSAMASSIYYAVDNGAKVISMSIGGSSTSTAIYNALDYAEQNNVLFVVCMMNFNNNVTYYPAGYSTSLSNVIAVGSTNPNDKRTAPFFWSATSGSNFGNHINVVAPGNYIYGLSHTSNTSASSYWGGTSQATPLVAGIASLLLSYNPSLTPLQIKTIIQDTAEDRVGTSSEDIMGFDRYMGFGRVNANNALQTLGVENHNFINSQEFQIINPEKNGLLEIYSKGQYEGQYSFIVNSIDGKLLDSNSVNIILGLNTFSFNYPVGNYIVTLKSNEYTKVFKVLKK